VNTSSAVKLIFWFVADRTNSKGKASGKDGAHALFPPVEEGGGWGGRRSGLARVRLPDQRIGTRARQQVHLHAVYAVVSAGWFLC
jgi:hypothetical protein